MKPFDHYSPKTLPEALGLLDRFNGEGMVIAGGTDLNLKMKAGSITPEAIINIKRLPELKGITFDKDSGLKLGALTTLRELTRSPLIKENFPTLARAAMSMASEQIRSFATLGGNLSNASPSADMAPPLIALDAEVTIVGKSTERTIPLEKFFHGPGSSALKPGELLKQINLPPPSGNTIFLKHSPRAFMDIAVVCIAINIEIQKAICKRAIIVLGAVSPVPLRVRRAEAELVDQPLSSENISSAAKIAAQECAPIDDIRGSIWYRRSMVEVFIIRGLHILSGLERKI